LPIPEGFFAEAMERLRNKFLNVPVDAVLPPASVAAQQVAVEQKDKARVALEEAGTEDTDQKSAATEESPAALPDSNARKNNNLTPFDVLCGRVRASSL
jgi:hypothetical protein